MRFATISMVGTLTGARVDGDRLVLLDARDAVDVFLRHGQVREIAEFPASGTHYARVSSEPAHILCVDGEGSSVHGGE